MDNDMEFIVVLITVPSMEEGEKIARSLVDNNLAACVNITPSVRSFFFWENKLCSEDEALLFVKSRKTLLDSIIAHVKGLHSYQVPEIIALPIVGGYENYLRWVEEKTS